MAKDFITLHGAFHGSNFGDLLLLQIQLSWLKKAGLKVVCVPNLTDHARDLIKIPEDLQIKDCCSKTIIFGGGGYFGAPSRAKAKWIVNWTRHHAGILSRAALTKRKVYLIGTEVGPLPPFPFNVLLKLAMRKAHIIRPRNEQSATYLKRLVGEKETTTIDAGIDIAVWLADHKLDKRKRSDDTEVLGIHLAPPLDDVERFAEFVNSLGIKLSTHGYRLRILVDQKGTNGAKRQRECGNAIAIASGLDYEVVTLETVDQFVSAIADCDRLITSKLHVGIVGRCYGVQVFSIPTHLKTIRFYQQIGEIERCKPWGSQYFPELLEDVEVFLDDNFDRAPLSYDVISRGNDMKEIFGEIVANSG